MSHLERLRREALAAPASGIVAIANFARGREGVIPMWTGEGDLPTPTFIAEATAESLRAGETFYTWNRGIPELRSALSRYTSDLYGRPTPPERFFVTGSGMHAIQITIAAIAGAGDEIVYLAPCWPNFAAALEVAGGSARAVALDWTDRGWALDLQKLEDAIGPRTRAIFINTPSNPTGWTADRQTLEDLLALAKRRNLFVIADEIYVRFFYEGPRAPSFHDVMEEGDPVFFVGSFSKNWAMTGWRIGWLEAPAEFGAVIENLIQYTMSGVATFMQRGAIAALQQGEPFVAEQVGRAAAARSIFTEALRPLNRVRIAAPAGAFYSFFAVEGMTDSKAVAFRAVEEAGVGLAPGSAFGPSGEGYLRVCFHRRLDQVEEAADRLARWIGTLA